MNLLIALVTGALVGWVTCRMLDPDPRLSQRIVVLIGALAAGISSEFHPVFDTTGGGGALSMLGVFLAAAVASGSILVIGMLFRRYAHE